MNEIPFEIVEHIAVIAEKPGGWTYELNRVSWNGKAEKYDLRNWSPDKSKSSKQAAFTLEELRAVRDALNKLLG